MSAEPEVIDIQTGEIMLRPTLAIEQWTPRLVLTVDDAVGMVNEKREFMARVMRKDEHYGVIPGAGTKPTLFKPGAELLLSSMALHPEMVDAAVPVVDITGRDHGGEPYIEYRRACIIYRQTGAGPGDRMIVGRAEGVCNSWEKKYRTRRGELVCPACGKATVLKSKDKPEFFCWRKKGGCGSVFGNLDPKITGQVVGDVPNPDIPDLMNTILKMADKRALVAATLNATGCSDLFTQDLEDMPRGGDDTPAPSDSDAPAAGGQKETRATAAPASEATSNAPAAASEPSAAQQAADAKLVERANKKHAQGVGAVRAAREATEEIAKEDIATLYEEAVELGTVYALNLNPESTDPRAEALARLDEQCMTTFKTPLDKLNLTSLQKVVKSYRLKVEAGV